MQYARLDELQAGIKVSGRNVNNLRYVNVTTLKPESKEPLKGEESEVKSLIWVRLFATPWTVAYQAPPSMGFPRQESWSGLPFPSPGDLPDPGIEPRSPTL